MVAGLIPADFQRPARQIEAGAALTETEQMAGHQGGAGARAAGQGGASAPLPHPHHQMAGVQHLHEVNVGAGREDRMQLQGSPQQLQIDTFQIQHRNHHMGIAHADGGYGQDLAGDGQIPLGEARRTDPQQGGNRRWFQEGRAHVDADAAIGLQLRHDATGKGFDLPAAAGVVAIAVGQKAGQAADAVAAHLRLAAVGIEDAHPQFAAFPGRQGQDHPIATDAEAAITKPLDGLRREAEGVLAVDQAAPIQEQKVVA